MQFSRPEESNYGPVAVEEESRKNIRLDLHNNAASKWTGVGEIEAF